MPIRGSPNGAAHSCERFFHSPCPGGRHQSVLLVAITRYAHVSAEKATKTKPIRRSSGRLSLQNDSAASEAALRHRHIFSRRLFLRARLFARLASRLLRRSSRLCAAVVASAVSAAPTSIAAAAPPRIATRNRRLV